MKSKALLSLGLCLIGGGAFAQQQSATPALVPNAKPVVAAAIKPLRVSGPLAQPLKAKGMSEISRQYLQLINPFAPSEPRTEAAALPARVEGRAWTTAVGWNPGGSAFPDPVTHEPTLALVTISRSR